MPARPTRQLTLLLVALVLLGGFALRAYNIGAVPVFVDEYNHIRRAQVAYDFDYNPMQTSHGKLLFYYWIGLFDPEGPGTLAVSRWANALISLLTGAAAGATARRLFGPRAVLPAVAFYALVPFAVFFDRTALADPLAGALASLAAWASIVLVQRPTVRHGLGAGVVITAAVLAKLTTAFVVGLPLVAALLLGPPQPPYESPGLRDRARALWARYRRAWVPAAVVFAVVWAGVLALAVQSARAGHNTYVMDTHLVQQERTVEDLLVEKWHDLRDRGEFLISAPLSVAMVALLAVLLRRRPRPGLYALAWLVAIWLPNLAFADDVQSRYLMAGVGALAALFAGEMVAAGDALAELAARRPTPLARERATAALAGVILLVWAAGFALPFDVRASTDPTALALPWRDHHDYFSYIYNAWGIREALAWLEDHGERLDGSVPVVGVVNHCGPPNLYVTDAHRWRCLDRWGFPGARMPSDVTRWRPVMDAVRSGPFVYVISEYPAILPPDAPPDDGPLRWELQATFPRPHGGITFAVWRATLAPS